MILGPNLQKSVILVIWESGVVWGDFWETLGGFGEALGRLWKALGRLWGDFRRLWGDFGRPTSPPAARPPDYIYKLPINRTRGIILHNCMTMVTY